MAKANPSDDNANSLVRFLLSALLAMKEVNPLVESYLAQLDMEDLGLEALRENVRMFGLERGVVSVFPPSFFPQISLFELCWLPTCSISVIRGSINCQSLSKTKTLHVLSQSGAETTLIVYHPM